MWGRIFLEWVMSYSDDAFKYDSLGVAIYIPWYHTSEYTPYGILESELDDLLTEFFWGWVIQWDYPWLWLKD